MSDLALTDPSLELQRVFVAALKAGTTGPLVGGKVYDSAPASATLPYVTLGAPQVLPDKADGIDGAETSFPVHGWAAGPQSAEIKRLGAAIAADLDEKTFAMTGHRVVMCQLEQIAYLDDPDGITRHVVVTLRVVTETAD